MARGQFLPNPDNEVEEVTFDVDTGNEPPTSAEASLSDLLETLNDVSDNIEFAIYKQLGTGKQSMQFVESLPHDKYSPNDLLMYIRDEYGDGDYRLQVRIKGRLKANKLISIAPKVKKTPLLEKGSENNTVLIAILERMEKQDEKMNALYRELSKPQSSRREFFEEMVLMKNLFSGNESKSSFSEVVSMLNGLKDIGVPVSFGQVEREEGFTDVLKSALPLIAGAMNQPQQPKPQQNNGENMNFQLKLGIQSLIRSAQAGKDPAASADFIDAQYGENAVQIVSAPGAFEKLAAIEPAVIPHKKWFLLLGEHIKAINGLPSEVSHLYDNVNDILENGDDDNELSINGNP